MTSWAWALLPVALGIINGPLTSVTQCGGATVPPNLALCLAGHARTFGDPRVVDGLLTNLVASFGANVTTFLYLKLHDHSTKGKDRLENLKLAVDMRVGDKHKEDVRRMAHRMPNVSGLALIEDDVVFRQPPCQKSREFRVDNKSGTAWRTEETWQMLVGQLYNQYWCGVSIEQYERDTGVKFDVVIKSRPDVTFAGPAPPYCAFDYDTKACTARDWLFMLPGSVAVKALKRGYEEFEMCRTIMNRNKTKIAEIIVRASGMGKELKEDMGRPDEACQKCKKGIICPLCRRKDTPLKLIRRPGVPSGSLPGILPRHCGF
ncbi:hypothetical protein CTAYLR_006939 [Chrysophaeum taylorii]|uniref:Copper-fist domain-containing protein n=1 Tax=Chrysophaeum taylorii TaxID=2483200 RepID=A0AAD7XKS3_9STRA|nr:hypothetical protein CTAYLR_006939 [Chrysophaeum taylorii]